MVPIVARGAGKYGVALACRFNGISEYTLHRPGLSDRDDSSDSDGDNKMKD